MKKAYIGSIVVLAFFAGCTLREPEGPAEQIGKGIDQVSRGIQAYDREAAVTNRAKGRIAEPLRETPKEDYSRFDAERFDAERLRDGPTPENWESYEEWRRRRGLDR